MKLPGGSCCGKRLWNNNTQGIFAASKKKCLLHFLWNRENGSSVVFGPNNKNVWVA